MVRPAEPQFCDGAKVGETMDMTELLSEAFDRQDCVVLMGESIAEGQKQQMLPIIRSGNHKFFGFGDSIVEKLDKMEGRFSQLLPTKVPDENMRAFRLAAPSNHFFPSSVVW